MAITPNTFKEMSQLISENISAGHYEVRLARTENEIHAAQALRYQVLYKESNGYLTEEMMITEREEDEWDSIAYHVIVIDSKNEGKIVGTVRLVSNSALKENQEFYTEHAFNIDSIRSSYASIMELSRACVSPEGRGGAILMLIWKFTMTFIEQNKYDVLFGCASFKGTDYSKHTDILSYLYQNHLASDKLMPKVKPNVDSISIVDFINDDKQNDRGQVPTLLRGYLKIGAKISDHAIIDSIFNTTFVAIYVDAKEMFQSNHALVNKSIESN